MDETNGKSGEPQAQEDEQSASLEKVLADSPESVKQVVASVVRMGMSISGTMPNPLAEKLTPEHLDKMIEYTETESQREDKQLTAHRKFGFLYYLIGIAVVTTVLLVLIFRSETDLVLQILSVIGAFGGGFGVGRLTGRGTTPVS